ncbi:cation-translocating P-type ATPase [Ohtaekwangia koreensis]|uniref:Ca2+-transporting ATPase n=1 Tax=Ohtaekwangia koreensis TaxID=688867 RepID=A0A1T5M6F7_9BACT|nr:cation-translocating P-type ATPase [Ohtaekwangia koreensis]SKC83614.1 Ca2+-transporting ATPase [Ohtaekwangia koreensis]
MESATTEYATQGLTSEQVLQARAQYGRNEVIKRGNPLLKKLKSILLDPMFILLLVAAVIYFVNGEIGNGIFMIISIVFITGISLYQESRSHSALSALKELTQPMCTVIRNGARIKIKKEEIVIGDYMVVEEGTSVPADGIILQSNDFSVNESILTGESLPVSKSKEGENNKVFQGTTIVGGLAICRVEAIGIYTALGRIGKSLEWIEEEETPLQKQIRNFVKKMALAGALIFFIVWGINFTQSREVLASLLKALTLAMSILPEEIPVAFSTFMALGAWRLMKLGVIVKHTGTVETLGSATVICTDKTGTITENKMSLAKVLAWPTRQITSLENFGDPERELVTWAMWASEPIPFDAMEIALHDVYRTTTRSDERLHYKMVHEYPLSGVPPMMTHVFDNGTGHRIIAAKGAPEALMKVCAFSNEDKVVVNDALQALTSEGFRVLGVGISDYTGKDFPATQQQLPFVFKGLVAFYDPPKKNIGEVFQSFYNAGIQVKIITGDNAATTSTIANQIHFRGTDKTLTGEELTQLTDEAFSKKVMEVNIFSRMFPDAKLKVLNALKSNGQIVAMTGDGVNDAPALKAAHIGIAMGKRGSEIAKEVSSLIISDDDLAKMVDAIAMGRRIYTNLKKAIQYIISIHIPIILMVFIPLALGWVYPTIFSPVHIIFLELIMGPTCSIIYENEPLEKNAMQQKPRPITNTFFSLQELSISIIQGLVITIGILLIYQYAVQHHYNEATTRTMTFVTLIVSNVFLTLVNRSFYYSIFSTIRYKNNLILIVIAITIILTASLLYIPALMRLFKFETLAIFQLSISLLMGFTSVIWFEGLKAIKRVSDA